ncbi:hypothetical protein DB459_22965 [Bradyrhizobium sp. WD16]|nr:hypothetical protein DB459_22965 [Bradyrhizobium sp. WD16]
MGQQGEDFDSYARLLETAYAEHDDEDILREYILQRWMIEHAPAQELLAHIFSTCRPSASQRSRRPCPMPQRRTKRRLRRLQRYRNS